MAQYELGCCYAKAEGVSYDYAEAARWWCQAAEQGIAMAQYELGLCYTIGYGVEQDYAEAVTWLRRAAVQDVAEAQYQLGRCYAEGRGVEQNTEEAAKWWGRAAEQGVAKAQYALGRLYADGTAPDLADVVYELYLVEQMPKFRGGSIENFRRWVMGMVKYPQLALENGIQGVVNVGFVVDERGDVIRVRVLQSPDPVLSEAAISVIKSSPKWTPGMQGGKAVKVGYNIPISFKIQN